MAGGKRGDETTRAAVDPNNKMIINQIMLKYRPIAPKPVSAERSGCLVPLKEKRSKRKYVRVKNKINDNYNNNNWMFLDKTKYDEFVVTDRVQKVPELISFDVSENSMVESMITRSTRPYVGVHEVDDLTTSVNRGHVVQSWITIESVTGACEDVSLLRWKDLEIDSCPGFISNGYERVQWVNLAYRRMVDLSSEKGAQPPQVSVWIKVKMEILSMVEYWQAFSCRVRVVYQYLEKKKQITVPCDVWKMDSGCYAWRLDVEAALSLGRLN